MLDTLKKLVQIGRMQGYIVVYHYSQMELTVYDGPYEDFDDAEAARVADLETGQRSDMAWIQPVDIKEWDAVNFL